MLSKKLTNEIKKSMAPKTKSAASCNLNFKIEAEVAVKLDEVSRALGMSRTELARFIVIHSLDEAMALVRDILDSAEPSEPELDDLDKLIAGLASSKIPSLAVSEEFELKVLLGDDWGQLGDHGNKNRAGKKFKKLVESGVVKDVRFLRTKSNNHAVYQRI